MTVEPATDDREVAIYAKDAFQEEYRRYEWCEVKTSRYLTVLTIVLGVNVVRIPDLVTIKLDSSAEWVFVIAFSAAFGTAFGALVSALQAMRSEILPALPVDDDMLKLFTDHPARDVLRGFAARHLMAARDLRIVNDRRFKSTHLAHRFMLTSVVATFVAVAFYIVVKAQEVNP